MTGRIRSILRRSPVGVVLMIAGVGSGAAAFWLHTRPEMLPWPTLAAWAGGIAGFLAGWWLVREPSTSALLSSHPALAATPAPPAELQRQTENRDMPFIFQKGFFHREVRVLPKKNPPPSDAPPGEGAYDVPVAMWEVVLVAALTTVGLFLRQVSLGTIPGNLTGDEAAMGWIARKIISGEVTDPFATGWLSHPHLWFFLQALSLKLFGDTVAGLRTISVIIGAATIPMLYGFARPLYGRPVAFVASGLLTVFHFHLHYSRNALNNIVDPCLALVVFAALFHGFRTRRMFSFALAGVALGLAQHFYMGSRLLFVLVALMLAHQAVFNRAHLLRLRWHLVVFVAGCVLAFGPLLHHYLKHPDSYGARLAVVGVFQSGWLEKQQAEGRSLLQIVADQAWNSFGAFTVIPASKSAQYSLDMPLLDPASSVLFVFGVVLLLARWQQKEAFFLLAWIVGTVVFGGMLLRDPPESPRYVTSAPTLCLTIALALVEMVRVLRWALALPRLNVYDMGAAAVGVLALWNVHFYFQVYTPRNNFGWLNTEVATEMGHYLAAQPDPVHVYFFGARGCSSNFRPLPSWHRKRPVRISTNRSLPPTICRQSPTVAVRCLSFSRSGKRNWRWCANATPMARWSVFLAGSGPEKKGCF
ncbi:MAG: glycosyltransferase family 39 protein [Chloroflexaceae bacterium]|nr:glycosyltransferase family 39 protein [Chloroflexaceae bacterium]